MQTLAFSAGPIRFPGEVADTRAAIREIDRDLGRAMARARRALPRGGTGLAYKPGHRADVDIFVDEKVLLQPLGWRRPRMIFVCSMTDLFADFVTDDMLDQVFAVMAASARTPLEGHTFQVLTKRPARMRAYLADPALPTRVARAWRVVGRNTNKGWTTLAWNADGEDSVPRAWPLPNVWLGTSCEDQATADARIPELLATPAAIRFVSAEPLLGPINLGLAPIAVHHHPDNVPSPMLDRLVAAVASEVRRHAGVASLDWVIVGGESGPRARPMHPVWARSIRDQSAAAGVLFHFKQWGEFAPIDRSPLTLEAIARVPSVAWPDGTIANGTAEDHGGPGLDLFRIGKRRAGRFLDGVEHNGMPGREAVHVA